MIHERRVPAISAALGRMGTALVASFALHGAALAQQNQVLYGPAAAWVKPSPAPTETATPDGMPLRIVYSDTQIHVGPAGTESYTGYRAAILRPEALPVGNISATWAPNAGGVTVHHLRIIRDGKAIDVLQNAKFQVIQRESNLEYSMLNGQLTATLQTPGLQVGDELEFAATVTHKDPTFGTHSFGGQMLAPAAMPGAFRIRLSWPEERALAWRTTSDVGVLTPTTASGQKELIYELRDPGSVTLTDGAPARANLRRYLEFSDFASWSDIATRVQPLFLKASTLRANSPIREEAARIAARTANPAERALAALRLVQDRIRYVYVGLDAGAYTPANADESWERRYGDCKAKTVLLLALLRELGVPAEAVLVNSGGGDGTDERLPSPGLFDHVLVRARIADKDHWLDGTRSGDTSLALLPPPVFRWALPLRDGKVMLEAVPSQPAPLPQFIEILDIDASQGFDTKAKVTMRRVMRGAEAFQIRTQLLAMSPQDASRAIQSLWRQQEGWMEAQEASWRYDEAGAALELKVVGIAKLDWEGDDEEGRSLDIFGAGFSPPAEYRRPRDQDATAPWVIDYPSYRCWATAIRLPPETGKWQWDYYADPVNRTLGGIAYWRVSDLRDNIVRTIMSRRYMVPEISASDATKVNALLPGFNNNVSQVYQVEQKDITTHPKAKAAPPFDGTTSWTDVTAPCNRPSALH